MTGDDQERFEDYLDLERYIEELQAGHVAHPPKGLTPGQAKIYRMAALFRSVSPEAAEPHPEFVEQLKARLLALEEVDQEEAIQKLPGSGEPVAQERILETKEHDLQEVQQPLPQKKETPKRAKFVSRRSLLTGGAVAAASLMAGAAVGATAERLVSQSSSTGTTPPPYDTGTPLVPGNVATIWQFVTTLAELGDRAIRFVSDVVIGYVIRNDGDNGEKDPSQEPVIAVSAACTHMGCIIQWNDSDRNFHCPCHGGLFNEYGKPANGPGRLRYLAALPRLNVKVENGKVYVQVPSHTA